MHAAVGLFMIRPSSIPVVARCPSRLTGAMSEVAPLPSRRRVGIWRRGTRPLGYRTIKRQVACIPNYDVQIITIGKNEGAGAKNMKADWLEWLCSLLLFMHRNGGYCGWQLDFPPCRHRHFCVLVLAGGVNRKLYNSRQAGLGREGGGDAGGE